MSLFIEILDRLLEDQEIDESHRLFGQFGRSRDKTARSFVQKDGESLDEKPEIYMTFNALVALLHLKQIITESARSIDTTYGNELKSRISRIEDAINMVMYLAERLLLKNSDENNFIKMRESLKYKFDDEFISYRHTIGTSIILALLGRKPDLEKQIITRLIDKKIQNTDGGWPIADRKYNESDILTSVHAIFLFSIVIMFGRHSHLKEKLEQKIHLTLAYLTLEAEKSNNYWIYGHDLGKIQFTARTYPELHNLLSEFHSPLLSQLPSRLAENYPVPDDNPYTYHNRKKTGVRNKEQVIIRLAYAFKMAAKNQPEKYLEKYAEARYRALSGYSKEEYYEAYDLCCLLMMLLDKFDTDTGNILPDIAYISEPVLSELPFVGVLYRTTKEVCRRLKDRGYLP